MTLDPKPPYPSTRSYVLKLHRATDPGRGTWVGRLENMASGRSTDFHSENELLAWLAEDLAPNNVDAPAPAVPPTEP